MNASGRTPLVVLPHGGPGSRDYGGFDWIAHFLATRGYTVLQPNFRGSAGFGSDWEEAGFGEWGIGVMQHDITDGVTALIDEELADPERVCIVGASYGGYAALAGAVFTPELYRCAVAIAPVTNLVDMIGFERSRLGGRSSAVSYWRDAMGGGDPGGLNDRLRAASPAAHAERANAPILLVHGRDDSVVPISQSREMENELLAAGKNVELIELDGEDHWLSVAQTRLATLQAVERFLAEHL
jgi:dipeptidyl aminopeptidase/acylaminoacyl peptidase